MFLKKDCEVHSPAVKVYIGELKKNQISGCPWCEAGILLGGGWGEKVLRLYL